MFSFGGFEMGYATVLNVPRVLNYTQAKEILTTTKPIRGTTTIPLGNRRDHHQYSIRKNGEDVELVCYRTSVVTFHPDDSITVKTDGWCSVSTHQFIQQVLGIPANGRGQFTVLSFQDSKVAISGNETARIKMGEDGKWSCLTQITRPSYRINRKAANNVRLRYKEFADYIKGFSKVRAELVRPKYGKEYMGIVINREELEPIFEIDADGDVVWLGTVDLMERSRTAYVERGEQMIRWVTSGDHEQYLKAALHLYSNHSLLHVNERYQPHYYVNPLYRQANLGPKNFDEFILRWHAEEVIEACETKPNAVPNTKYESWLRPKKA
jgi:hypothetical protein